MRSQIARVLVIAGVLTACGRPSQEQQSNSQQTDSTAAQAGDSAQARDSASLHAGHQMTDSVSVSSAGHVGHAAADHSAHEAAAQPAGRTDAAHAAHAANPRTATHAAHAAARPDSAHAAHAAARPDSAHAAHAAARPDSAHAAHAAARPDSAHAAHAAQRPADDTAHTAHVAAAADPHAAHGATAASAAMQGVHRMWMQPLGAGWTLMGMAQAFPIISTSLTADEGSPLDATELYLTQPALMFNIESPGSRITLRTTLNFEGLTQSDGELTFGGWGEGFIDRRHPHTLLHEFMLSVNLWNFAAGDLSISAGKGFAPYGTDDPMSRPAVKYPTNHHLSQILERWTVNGVYMTRGWSVEAAVFGGGEPEGPYDMSNIESFGDSWSARVARRFGSGYGPMAETEVSASFGRVREVHHEAAVITKLYNASLRHDRPYSFGTLYGLVEGSLSRPQEDDGYYSLLGEMQLNVGAHQPYYRIEYATRPEYAREGAPGTADFFRYDHDAHAIGATRWIINSVGYGRTLTGYPVSARPFIEVQHQRVSAERGGIEPQDLFGRRSFWGMSAGFRVFLGGNPMRMGSYGVLDAMTSMHRGGAMANTANGGAHRGHE